MPPDLPLSNKITAILQTFSPQELKQFKKWLQSPFHNEQAVLPQLFGLLYAELKKQGRIASGKEQLWKKLHIGQPYSDVRFRRYCSDLTRQAEAFLSYQTYTANPMNPALDLLQALANRKLKPLYNATFDNTQQLQTHPQPQSAQTLHHQYRLQLMRHQLKQGAGRQGNWDILGNALERLDEYYIAEKLKYYCNWLNYKMVLQPEQERSFWFTDHLITYLAQQPPPQLPPLIAVYLAIAATLTHPEQHDNYTHLKKLLQQHAHLFDHNEAWTMYGYAQNFCIRQINSGNNTYLTELFELYADALQRGLIFTDGQLSPWHYKNMVVVALRLKAYNWAQQFIEEYRHRLPARFAQTAYIYNKAKLHFHKAEYGKVIELLREVAYQDVFYELDSKAMLLKTYYETEETEALLSLLASFRIFLRRKKGISEQHRTNYLNLVRFTEKLLALPAAANKDATDRLAAQLQKTRRVADANWLREKLEELSKPPIKPR
ncbi:hypothetical protein BVG80_15190 [Sphingobacteriales bacterium TSM_CSM]|nr:hypothetical protein BVG80_15190 [Sphingobacteriales bacterium TSM_CSM]